MVLTGINQGGAIANTNQRLSIFLVQLQRIILRRKLTLLFLISLLSLYNVINVYIFHFAPWKETKPFNLSVISIFKNEGDILKEWLEHHISQGVDHFYLVDNGSDDNFRKELTPYEDKITLFTDNRKYKQKEILNSLLNVAKSQSNWILNIDLDEFVYVRPSSGYGTISTALTNITNWNKRPFCRKIAAIILRWTIFGSSGHIQQPPSVRMNFTMCNQELFAAKSGKYIVNSSYLNNNIWNRRPQHAPQTYFWGAWYNQCLTNHHDPNCDYNASIFRINHYSVMSWNRFQNTKMTRGDVSTAKHNDIRNEYYFKGIDETSKADCSELADIVRSYENTAVFMK